jgi:hypothetical protein
MDVQRQQTAFLITQIERINQLMQVLAEKGALTSKDVAVAQLRIDLKHAERKARILKYAGRDVTDIEEKLKEIRAQLLALEATA